MKKVIFLLLFAFSGFSAYAQSLNDALAAIEAEKYEKAGIILDNLVKSNPDDGLYQFHRGNLYLILGEDEKARDSFERGITLKKNSQINHIGLGRILLDEGNATAAAAEFARATEKIKKKDTEKYLYIAQAYYNTFNPDYAKAAQYAQKVVEIDPRNARGYLVLGDAQYKLDNLNEAYMAYRNAFNYDNSLLRAKLNLAVITKDAHAFPEAVRALEEIITLDPSYGPTYRELAEIHYLWATLDRNAYSEHIEQALAFYEKYMQLTDYSLDSRMRHADFLVLAKDYAALEREAMEMQKIDKVNPRILRYLGYSAYENQNYSEAADAITRFLSVINLRRALGMDYLYLAKAQLKLIEAAGITPVDHVKLSEMLASLAKAIEMEAPVEGEFSEYAGNLYKAREYDAAADVFEVLINTPKARLVDMMYFANAIFYRVANLEDADQVPYIGRMQKADSVYGAISEASPTTQDTYYNRARLNRFIPNSEDRVAAFFEDFVNVTTEKGESELAKPVTRRKLAEAYISLGAHYSDIDAKRAIRYFEKALEFEPGNEDAELRIKFLRGN